MAAIIGMSAWGFLRFFLGDLPQAESAHLTLLPEDGYEQGLVGLAGGFLLLRAFSSGCAALTGVEAISNGVPAFQKPKSRNAATTLALLGGIAVTMLMSVITLANLMDLRFAEFPAEQLLEDGGPVGEDYEQAPVIGQIAHGGLRGLLAGFYLVAAVTGVILVLAANTAFNGFPVLGSILARDDLLPRQLHTRGDRLAFSNGIIFLAAAASLLIVAFDARGHPADPALHRRRLRLVHAEPDRHGPALDPARCGPRRDPDGPAPDEALAGSSTRSALSITGSVLVVVLITKFTHGAWIAILAMAVLFLLMRGDPPALRTRCAPSWRRGRTSEARVLPSRVHAIVLVSKVHKPTLRALAYARATRPVGARGGHRRRRPGGDPAAAAGVGGARHPGAAAGARLAVPGDHPAGRSTTCAASAGRARATSSSCSSRSTSSATGGSSCCTTRARCGSRAGCFHARRHGRERAVAAAVVVRARGARGRRRARRRAARLAGRRPGGAADGGDGAATAATAPTAARCAAAGAAERPDLLELEVGPVAHGGHCVARHEGRVVFVRHALPGERRPGAARPAGRRRPRSSGARTPSRSSRRRRTAWRRPARSRAPAACGGCDWQHAALAGAARGSRPRSSREQLARLAGLSAGDGRRPAPVVVEAAAGRRPAPRRARRWRTRVRFAVDGAGRPGPAPAPLARRRPGRRTARSRTRGWTRSASAGRAGAARRRSTSRRPRRRPAGRRGAGGAAAAAEAPARRSRSRDERGRG